MASEIKVDTIVNAGGDNDTGIDLATNDQILLKVANSTKLTMNSTGQTTIVGEGGTTTTSVQQGLAKAWVSFNGTGTIAQRDSFNVSSLNDDGTGKYDFVYTNNMSSQNYAPAICGAFDDNDGAGNTHVDVRRQAPSTNLYGIRGLSFGSDASGSLSDCQFCYAQIAGDLA